jgi:glycine/D-amino acid oxidase-like deaminating enzyme
MEQRQPQRVVIVGGGAFGLSAGLELRRRGHAVSVLDPGPIPHPHASSTDISKALRMDYGQDEFYMELMELAFEGWDAWNRDWPKPLYHETGFLFLAQGPLEAGGFERDSFDMLRRRGHAVERLDQAARRARFPAWSGDRYPDGYFNPRAGWAESGKVVARLAELAKSAGVSLHEGVRFAGFMQGDGAVRGIVTQDGERFPAEVVLIAAGAWTPVLLPELQDVMWPVAQPVLHFRVERPEEYQPPRFTAWAADIANTGWYGFPALPDGTLKVANHGPGRRMHPDDPRAVDPGEEARFRQFFREALPDLADAPLILARLCFYCDTWDGDFWIDHDPHRPGLVVAAGGSGHAFKFTPVLGPLIADVVERRPSRFAARFAWRERGQVHTEEARFVR